MSGKAIQDPKRGYTTPAIVIRVRAFGETSQVIHLATPEHGMVAAMAKGSQRPGPEFQGGIALCTAGTAWLLRPFVGHPDQPFSWFRERTSKKDSDSSSPLSRFTSTSFNRPT